MTNLENIALYLLPMFPFLLGIIAFFKSLSEYQFTILKMYFLGSGNISGSVLNLFGEILKMLKNCFYLQSTTFIFRNGYTKN